MEMIISQAGIVRLPQGLSQIQVDQLQTFLGYEDSSAEFNYRHFKKFGARWVRDENEFKAKADALKAEIKKSTLFQDEGGYWTYSGLAQKISDMLKVPLKSEVTYPKPKGMTWSPEHEPWPFQVDAAKALIGARHGGVSIGTGLGKSMIIAMLIAHYGLKVVVMTPSSSISDQLYKDFVKWFGASRVGAYFEGSKEANKLITVGNAQSLRLIKEGSKAYELLSKADVFIADESHQTPAATFEKVCMGVFVNAPYRFFFSATQIRGDGKGIVLDGITGPIVYAKTVREGINEKYLAEPRVRMISVPPNGERYVSDPNTMTRHHLFYNTNVIERVGILANQAAQAGMPVLVLVEEIEQFTRLQPYLQFEAGFAHGGVTKDNVGKLPPQYHESDKAALVEAFNAGKLPILVGTSCISTGTNITAVKFLIYWQGGQSEVQVKQAIGRATRKAPGKTFCHIVDFDVQDQNFISPEGKKRPSTCHRHAMARIGFYRSLTDRVVQSS